MIFWLVSSLLKYFHVRIAPRFVAMIGNFKILFSSGEIPSIPEDDLLRYAISGDLIGFKNAIDRILKEESDALTPAIGQSGKKMKVLASVTQNKTTCLQLAAANGHAEIIEEIESIIGAETCLNELDKSKFIDFVGSFQTSALMLALANGHEIAACKLLQMHASIDGTIARHRNATFLVARSGMIQAAKLIHERVGAEVFLTMANTCDTNGFTSLMAAALMNHGEMCNFLIKLGCKVTHAAKDGSTALHVACRISPATEAKANNAREPTNTECNTNLKVGSTSALSELLTHCSAIDLLAADSFGSTPLHIAALSANSDALDQILSHFSFTELIAQDNDGLHPTHTACQELIRNALDIKHECDTNEVARMRAHVENSFICVKKLLLGGYPLHSLDYSDASILHALCYCPGHAQLDLIKYICTQFCDSKSTIDHATASQPLPPLTECSTITKKSTTHLLSRHELEQLVAARNDSGWTCMHVAANTGGEHFVEVLELLKTCVPSAFLATFDASLPKQRSTNGYISRRGAHNRIPSEIRKAILQGDYSPTGIARYLCNLPRTPKVVVLAGAGISTSVGIKDFRSSDGLYSNSSTAELFSTQFLEEQPERFYAQMRELFLPVVDKTVKPSKAHAFLRLLKEMNWLDRLYTQNIDMLEYPMLSEDDVVECHGSCRQAYCMASACRKRLTTTDEMEEQFWSKVRQSECPTCLTCGSYIRPDVTFFGEPLPERFTTLSNADLPDADVVLVMGTSLLVYPVAALPQMAGPNCVRVLINREARGCFQHVPPHALDELVTDTHKYHESQHGSADATGKCDRADDTEQNQRTKQTKQGEESDGERQRWHTSGYRDIFLQSGCDEGVTALVEALSAQEGQSHLRAQFEDICKRYCS